MCNICNKQEAKFAMTGLSGRMCTSCHDAILKARKGETESAKEYFASINIQSVEARLFVDNELRESEMRPAPVSHSAKEKSSASSSDTVDSSADPLTDSRQVLNKIVNDINTIKSILIFFLIMTFIGLGGTFLYVMQIVNAFKDLY